DVDPTTGKAIAEIAEGGEADVHAAILAARTALRGPWSALATAARVELLRAVADGITKRFEDFVDAEVLDTGKPRSLAAHLDVPRGAANFKVFADIVANAAAEVFEMTTPAGRPGLN